MKEASLSLSNAFLRDCMSGGRRMSLWVGTGLIFTGHLKGYDAESLQISIQGSKMLIRRDAVWAAQYPAS